MPREKPTRRKQPDADELLSDIVNEQNPWIAPVNDPAINEAFAVASNPPKPPNPPPPHMAVPKKQTTAHSLDKDLSEFAVAESNTPSTHGLAIDAPAHQEEPFLAFGDNTKGSSSAVMEVYASSGFRGSASTDPQINYALLAEQPSKTAPRPPQYKPPAPSRPQASNPQAVHNREQLAEAVLNEKLIGEDPGKSFATAVLRQAEEDLEPESSAIVGDVYKQSIATTTNDDILDRLLSEARRIQWDHAASQSSFTSQQAIQRNPAITNHLRALAQRRRSAASAPPLTQAEKSTLMSVYASLREASASDASDSILEALLSEARRIVESRTVHVAGSKL